MITTKEKIKVMQAFEDGKKIEGKPKGKDDWTICDYPSWNWQSCEFRIKKEPKYIPFGWSDREQLRGKWVGLKEKNEEYLITGFELTRSAYVFFNEECVSFRELFEQYEFLDGSPCGKLEEE